METLRQKLPEADSTGTAVRLDSLTLFEGFDCDDNNPDSFHSFIKKQLKRNNIRIIKEMEIVSQKQYLICVCDKSAAQCYGHQLLKFSMNKYIHKPDIESTPSKYSKALNIYYNDDYWAEYTPVQPEAVDTIEQQFVKCPKCESRKIRIIVQQLRGGDEGSSVIYNCQSCNKQWIER